MLQLIVLSNRRRMTRQLTNNLKKPIISNIALTISKFYLHGVVRRPIMILCHQNTKLLIMLSIATPLETSSTFPLFFSNTKMRFSSRNAILVGEFSPSVDDTSIKNLYDEWIRTLGLYLGSLNLKRTSIFF